MVALDAKLIAAWEGHLRQELSLHRELLTVTDDKIEALIRREQERFSDLVEVEQEQLQTARQLRLRRVRMRALTAQELGIAIGDLRFARVLEHVAEDDRPRLAELQDTGKELLRRLQRSSEKAMALIRASLGLVSDTLAAITGASPEGDGYTRTGREQDRLTQAGALVSFQA
jgi:hypothetical protein